jgi:hypothetical protein
MTLREPAAIGRKRFEGQDWKIVNDVYAAIHDMVALAPELPRRQIRRTFIAAFTVATLWCDHVARCAGAEKISMEFASSGPGN